MTSLSLQRDALVSVNRTQHRVEPFPCIRPPALGAYRQDPVQKPQRHELSDRPITQWQQPGKDQPQRHQDGRRLALVQPLFIEGDQPWVGESRSSSSGLGQGKKSIERGLDFQGPEGRLQRKPPVLLIDSFLEIVGRGFIDMMAQEGHEVLNDGVPQHRLAILQGVILAAWRGEAERMMHPPGMAE